jgi:hypothetical protein
MTQFVSTFRKIRRLQVVNRSYSALLPALTGVRCELALASFTNKATGRGMTCPHAVRMCDVSPARSCESLQHTRFEMLEPGVGTLLGNVSRCIMLVVSRSAHCFVFFVPFV